MGQTEFTVYRREFVPDNTVDIQCPGAQPTPQSPVLLINWSYMQFEI